MTDYAPMYSTHGHGRKTHISTDGGSLCGVEQRYPDRLWTMGAAYYNVKEQFLTDPDGYGCRRCRRIYQRTTNDAQEGNEGNG